MLLLLIRHAHAGDRDPAQWPDDTLRPISDKGRKVQQEVGRFLRKRELAPHLVLTSPWLRAAQTADLLVEAARVAQPPVPCEPLATEPDLIRLSDYAGSQPPEAIVAMVGHSPWIEELASLLLGGSSAALRIDFPKSGVMAIDVQGLAPGEGELRFFLRPKLI